MTTYSYIAIDKKGKEIKATINAESQDKAIESLRRNGMTLASITETGALGKDLELGFLQKKPKARDMAVFCRQFVSIINAGVSVVDALEMLADQTENKKLKKAVGACKVSIEKGESLASAMSQHREVFSDIFVTMAEAGELSGSLDISFTRMGEQFEKEEKLKATVKKASIYPIVVFVVAIIVVIAMLTFVVPTFESMFTDLGTELPGITKAVIAASKFMQSFWYILIAAVVGIVLLVRMFKASDAGKHFFGKLGMKLPLFGKLTVKTASAMMARTLSTLLGSGIPLIEALEITSGVMTNVYFREALEDAKDDVAMGNPLSETLKRCGVFPPMVYHMVGIGEETGDIEGMLSKLAEYYEEEVEQATAQVMAALEPVIIIVLAGLVGTIILSVIMPMATMYGALDNL
ncbi:MAG: type II secretion system F family protein [Clostridia bacterium]|nr:type II secretion system F family protein [Clostridia bacterium]